MQATAFAQTVETALIGKLEALRDEVRKLAEGLSDQKLWQKPLANSNSVGHLILHLTGNLNHFVGAQLGNSGYKREREREFTEASVPARSDLLRGLDDAVATFRRVVGNLTEEQLTAPHPHKEFGTVITALISLLTHFALHHGQMSYIVRLLDQK
jgi:uncharacterized damage-inducible protein DinB